MTQGAAASWARRGASAHSARRLRQRARGATGDRRTPRRRRDLERRLALGSAALSRSSCRLSLSWRGDARSSSELGTQRGVGAHSARRLRQRARGATGDRRTPRRRRDQERRLALGSAALSRSSCRLSLSWRGDARSSSELGTQRGVGALGAAATAARARRDRRSAHATEAARSRTTTRSRLGGALAVVVSALVELAR